MADSSSKTADATDPPAQQSPPTSTITTDDSNEDPKSSSSTSKLTPRTALKYAFEREQTPTRAPKHKCIDPDGYTDTIEEMVESEVEYWKSECSRFAAENRDLKQKLRDAQKSGQ